jgi:hypothetical protein
MAHTQSKQPRSRRRLYILLATLAIVVLGVGFALYGPMFSTAGVPPELKPFPTQNPDGLKPSPLKPSELKPFPKK